MESGRQLKKIWLESRSSLTSESGPQFTLVNCRTYLVFARQSWCLLQTKARKAQVI